MFELEKTQIGFPWNTVAIYLSFNPSLRKNKIVVELSEWFDKYNTTHPFFRKGWRRDVYTFFSECFRCDYDTVSVIPNKTILSDSEYFPIFFSHPATYFFVIHILNLNENAKYGNCWKLKWEENHKLQEPDIKASIYVHPAEQRTQQSNWNVLSISISQTPNHPQSEGHD